MSSLTDLARKLSAEGPWKQEPTNRRVRGLLGGKWVFDSLDVHFVWEHKYYPYFYVPAAALEAGLGELARHDTHEAGFWTGTLAAGTASVQVAGFSAGDLTGLVKIPHGSLEAWYAEEEKVLGTHPRNPYTRIECLPSSRAVRVEVDGTVVAQSTNNIFLHETGLNTRYYLSPTSVVDWSMLVPSDTKTYCPYKGEASYYHIKVSGKEVKDAIWYYPSPLPESAKIQGLLGLYHEKLSVFVDGVKV